MHSIYMSSFASVTAFIFALHCMWRFELIEMFYQLNVNDFHEKQLRPKHLSPLI